jgi:hypothetical protein
MVGPALAWMTARSRPSSPNPPLQHAGPIYVLSVILYCPVINLTKFVGSSIVHGQINNMNTKAKFRHLKKLGFAAGVY